MTRIFNTASRFINIMPMGRCFFSPFPQIVPSKFRINFTYFLSIFAGRKKNFIHASQSAIVMYIARKFSGDIASHLCEIFKLHVIRCIIQKSFRYIFVFPHVWQWHFYRRYQYDPIHTKPWNYYLRHIFFAFARYFVNTTRRKKYNRINRMYVTTPNQMWIFAYG